MIAAYVEPSWPRWRWLKVAALVLIVQVSLIFALSEKKPAIPIPIPDELGVSVPANPGAESPGLSSPAFFVLANRHGFSGNAWMKLPSLPYDLPKWVDPSPPTVTNPVPQLVAGLQAYVQTNLAGIFQLALKPEPEPDLLIPFANPGLAQSTFTIEDELARRPLITKFNLPSWPSADILTNSIVLAGVDQSGNVFSAVLLPDGKSGSKDADASALRQVSSARFQPLRPARLGEPTADETRLHWGRFIFHWDTVAPPATNNNPPSNSAPAAPIINTPHE